MTAVYHHYVDQARRNFFPFRAAFGLTQQAVANQLQVTVQTVRRWESGMAPFWAVEIIYLRARSPAAHGKQWQGWYFQDGCLVSPEGDFYESRQIRAVPFMRQALDSWIKQRREEQPKPKFNPNKLIDLQAEKS